MTRPRFTSILVSVTEGCHVGCAHCGFIGSTRERETEAGDLREWVSQACAYGVPVIIFTGGEPFERYEVLREGVRAAAAHGVPSSLFTSSAWATSPAAALTALGDLPGLQHLYLSTDAYHQARVPYDNVYHVIAAADALEIPYVTLCITYANDEDRLDVRAHYERYGARVRFHESRVIPTPFIQRALRKSDPATVVSEAHYEPSCWIDTPLINPNGDLCACHVGKIGSHGNMEDLPYWLGNLRRDSFADIMARAARNTAYQYLRAHGPQGIARLYQEYPHLSESVGRSGFTGPCDLCFSTLFTPEGRRCLREYAARPDVVMRTNARLALTFGEMPMEDTARPAAQVAP